MTCTVYMVGYIKKGTCLDLSTKVISEIVYIQGTALDEHDKVFEHQLSLGWTPCCIGLCFLDFWACPRFASYNAPACTFASSVLVMFHDVEYLCCQRANQNYPLVLSRQ